MQAKDDNSELELASIEQQRANEDVLKLLDDQEVCTFLILYTLFSTWSL